MPMVLYSTGLEALANGTIDWANDPVYAILLGAGYTFDVAHDTYSDVSAEECTDGDYDPVAVTGRSIALVAGDIVYDSDDVSYGATVTIAAQYIVFVAGDYSSPDAGDLLIGAADFGTLRSSLASNFAVTTANGVVKLEV